MLKETLKKTYDDDYYDDEFLNARTKTEAHFLKALGEKIKEQVFGKNTASLSLLESLLKNKTHIAVFGLGGLLSLVALSSYGCNKEAVTTLAAQYEKNYGFKLPQALIDLIAEFAALGGTGSNMVLTFVGTKALIARFETLLSSLTKGQRHYCLAYLTVMGSAVFAAATNGLVVATEASTPQKAAIDFFINFLAALGPHMLFGPPFVDLILHSPIGDGLNRLGSALRIFPTEKPLGQADRIIFNSSILMIKNTGYHLSTLSVKEQVVHIQKILAKILWQEDSPTLSEEDEISDIHDASNRRRAPSAEAREKWEAIQKVLSSFNPTDEYRTDEYTQYLADFNSAFSLLSIEEKVRFFLVAGKHFDIPYASKTASRFLTLLKAGAIPVFALACLTNLINLRIFGEKIAEWLGAEIFGQTLLGITFFAAGAPAKIGMYVNSGLSMMMRLYFLLQTLLWIWHSNKAVKAFFSVAGALALLIALLSGACYALDASNLYGDAAFGYLLDFFALFGPEIGKIAQTVFISIAWGLGAGLVNANAFVETLTKIVLSLIHCWYPEQKEKAKASEDALGIVGTITGNLIHVSPSGIAVSETMCAIYDERQEEIPVGNKDKNSEIVDDGAPVKKKSRHCLSFFSDTCSDTEHNSDAENKSSSLPISSNKQKLTLFAKPQNNLDEIVVGEAAPLLSLKQDKDKEESYCAIM